MVPSVDFFVGKAVDGANSPRTISSRYSRHQTALTRTLQHKPASWNVDGATQLPLCSHCGGWQQLWGWLPEVMR
eukprot:2923163-Amphidinium_carterae.1